jgi:hypothetical protein
MKKGEAEDVMPHLVEKWADEAKEPWPPDGRHHYGLESFWTWLQNNHHPYTVSRRAQCYVAEMWFDKITKQTWPHSARSAPDLVPYHSIGAFWKDRAD